MGRFTGILLASDVDGTLFGHTGRVLPIDREAISYFISEGGTFTLATGRTQLALKVLLPQLEMNAPALLGNGALAYDYRSEKTVFEQNLSNDCLDIAKIVAEEFPEVATEIHGAEELRVFRPNEGTRAHFEYIGETGIELSSLEDAPLPWLKIVFVEQPAYLARLKAFLAKRFGDEYSMVSAYPLFLEFLHKDANKGAGLERLSKMLGSPKVYCIGDADNDMPMITRFESFAPANAEPEVKAAATHKVCDCDSGAVAQAIEWLGRHA